MAYNLRKRSHSKINYTENGLPNRALYLYSLPPRVTESALMTHFGKYGEVEGCEILVKRTGFEYSVVTFKRPEDAAAAFARKNHRICKQQLQVSDDQRSYSSYMKKYREKYPANSTENDSINLTGTRLIDLNDNCLMAILSNLFISDLCAVSETCSRLREVAGYVFSLSRKYIMWEEFRFGTFPEARRILVNFGPLIPNLSIGSVEMRKFYQQLDLLNRYCGDTLQDLFVHRIEVSKTLALKLQALFANSKKIQTWKCSIHHTANTIDMFANCKRLESLCIREGTALDNMFSETTIPTLKSFSTIVDGIPDLDCLRSFVVRHPHLEQLYLEIKTIDTTSDDSHYYDVLFEDIGHNLKNLEIVKIWCSPSDSIAYWSSVQRLAELQYLKNVILDCAGGSIASFLNISKSMATLQRLELNDTIVSEEFFTSIAKFESIGDIILRNVTFVDEIHRIPALPQLTRFGIYRKVDSVNANPVKWEWLFELVKKSPKLHSVSLCGLSFVLDDVAYLRLVNIIARQSNRATLTVCTRDVCVDHQTYVENKNFVKYFELSPCVGRKRKR